MDRLDGPGCIVEFSITVRNAEPYLKNHSSNLWYSNFGMPGGHRFF